MFKSSYGHTFAVTGDGKIAWNDPNTGEWEAKPTNQAGWLMPPDHVFLDRRPEIREDASGNVRVGSIFALKYIGPPLFWALSIIGRECTLPDDTMLEDTFQ